MTPADRRRHAERLLEAHALPEGDPAALVSLLERCTIHSLPTGQVLFAEGDPAGDTYFLLEGRARVLKKDHSGREREIGSWFAPAVIGALAAIDNDRRSATCVAGAPSIAAALDAKTARQVLQEPGPEGAHLRWILLAAFTETLANTTEHLRTVLSEGDGTTTPDLDRLQALLYGAKR
jgi:CRP-like cAMP-binding protein